MTDMDDDLARARRALRRVSGELDLTWGDVLARVDGEEIAPVVPVGDVRRHDRRRWLAAAAALVVVLGGAGTGLAVDRHRSAPPALLPPAASGAAPTTGADPPAHGSDKAQAIVDQALEALGGTDWCGVALVAATPRLVLDLDPDLTPVALLGTTGRSGRTSDGTLVEIDDTGRTWRVLGSPAEMLAGRPALATAVHALHQFLDDKGVWLPPDERNAPGVTASVDGETVALVVDPRTEGLTRLVPESAPAGFDVTWLPCDGSTNVSQKVSVPDDYARVADDRTEDTTG